jgi:uncharacterized protein YecE (DUF72 family)
MGELRIGTSGWIYKDWRGLFYPSQLPVKKWFSYYRRSFDTVEINNTFYRLPSADVFQAWRDQAPEGFLYAVKASRFLTHMKRLKEPQEPLQNILGNVRRLGPQLGPILYQLPPYWRRDVRRLKEFLVYLPPDLCHVFEFRDESWYTDEVQELLSERNVAFCIHDMRGHCCPDWVTSSLVYFRFHGPLEKKYHGRYERAHIQRRAECIQELRHGGRDVFAYFNNDYHANAIANARELQEFCMVKPLTAETADLFS